MTATSVVQDRHPARPWCEKCSDLFAYRMKGGNFGPNNGAHTCCALHVRNPWALLVRCPTCDSDQWTMPVDGDTDSSLWRCVSCHLYFELVAS